MASRDELWQIVQELGRARADSDIATASRVVAEWPKLDDEDDIIIHGVTSEAESAPVTEEPFREVKWLWRGRGYQVGLYASVPGAGVGYRIHHLGQLVIEGTDYYPAGDWVARRALAVADLLASLLERGIESLDEHEARLWELVNDIRSRYTDRG